MAGKRLAEDPEDGFVECLHPKLKDLARLADKTLWSFKLLAILC